MTNHHCVVGCVKTCRIPGHDFVEDGFVADARSATDLPGPAGRDPHRNLRCDRARHRRSAAQPAQALVKARDAAIAGIESRVARTRRDHAARWSRSMAAGSTSSTAIANIPTCGWSSHPNIARAPSAATPTISTFRAMGRFPFLRTYETANPVKTPIHLRWNPRAPGAGRTAVRRGQSGHHPAPVHAAPAGDAPRLCASRRGPLVSNCVAG